VVHPKVRQEVPDQHVCPTESVAEISESRSSQADTQIAQENGLGILVLVQWAVWVEVVDTVEQAVRLAFTTALPLPLVEVVAGHVRQKIIGPANKLLKYQHQEREGRRLLGQFRKLMHKLASTRSVLFPSSREEDHVALHVGRCLVVLTVGHLPAEVRYQQGRVEDPSDQVVEGLRWRKGAVAALVGEHPESRTEASLHEGVDAPK